MKKNLTIYDVQVNCARLSKEKIENLARIVKENGGVIYKHYDGIIKNDHIYFSHNQFTTDKHFDMYDKDRDLQSVSYARFVEMFDKKELEAGKWYKDSTKLQFVFRQNDDNNFGVIDSNWNDKGLYCSDPKLWTLATEQEVKKLLVKEAKNRLGKDWENAKIKAHADGYNGLLNNGNYYLYYSISEDSLWNKNGRIYHKGKWTELLREEVTQFTNQQMEAIKSMESNVDIITIENPSQETKDMCMKLRKDKEGQKKVIRESFNATHEEKEAIVKSVEAIDQMGIEIEKTMNTLSKPSHYRTKSGYDVIDLWHDNKLNANQGAMCKYILRAGKKLYPNMNERESYLADLKKAFDHMSREIEYVEKELGK